MTKLVITMVCLFVMTNTCFAKPRHYGQAPTKTYSYAVDYGSDQERCQAEANYMASRNITGHVWEL